MRNKTANKKINVLVLYSWENDENDRKDSNFWTMAFCERIARYERINADCDMLFVESSDIVKQLEKKIKAADKIVVIVTASYNDKIADNSGVVSYEERLYSQKIKGGGSTNDIVFIKKEDVDLPDKWKSYKWFDLSWLNITKYNELSQEQRSKDLQDTFNSIANFLLGNAQYSVRESQNNYSKRALTFEELLGFFEYDVEEQGRSLVEDENRLIDFIKVNINQTSFIQQYIEAGPSKKSNLYDRITPALFDKYFLVKRPIQLERNYRSKLNDLFQDPFNNMLCVTSDGGSGKSVFIQSMYLRDEWRVRNHKYYRPCVIDFENKDELRQNKASLLARNVRKLFRSMVKGDQKEQAASVLWRYNFKNALQNINDKLDISDPELREDILDTVEKLRPDNQCYDIWEKSFSKRIRDISDTFRRKKKEDTFFVVLLMLLILLFNTRPQISERYIVVFDNIETFDSGDDTERIANFTLMCRNTIKSIFSSLGQLDAFNTKFSFVIVLRTSTEILFGNIARSDLFCHGKYIIQLKPHDYTVEALLLKLHFLKSRIPCAEDSTLYLKLRQIINVFIPDSQIEEALSRFNQTEGESIKTEMRALRHFAAEQFMPLFNNNFRTAMELLTISFTDEATSDTLSYLITRAKNASSQLYNYMINGARMIIIHSMFKSFRYDILEKIGFHNIQNDHNHSMTRMILAYLYWDFCNYQLKHNDREFDKTRRYYKGPSLASLIDTFHYFCSEDEFTDIIFNLSIYTREIPGQQDVLMAWGNLLIFEETRGKVTRDELYRAIRDYIQKKDGESADRCKKIRVRLSEAGFSFTLYYVRSFEFLSARDAVEEEEDDYALFAIEGHDRVIAKIRRVKDILANCVEKLLQSCEKTCKLYKGEGMRETCILNQQETEQERDLLSCSLFLRFQECMDMIRENMDYIDRYRIVQCVLFGDTQFNEGLLSELEEYHGLYRTAIKKLYTMNDAYDRDRIDQFRSNWYAPQDFIFNTENSGKMRIIQGYFAKKDENIEQAIKKLKTRPNMQIYDALIES